MFVEIGLRRCTLLPVDCLIGTGRGEDNGWGLVRHGAVMVVEQWLGHAWSYPAICGSIALSMVSMFMWSELESKMILTFCSGYCRIRD